MTKIKKICYYCANNLTKQICKECRQIQPVYKLNKDKKIVAFFKEYKDEDGNTVESREVLMDQKKLLNLLNQYKKNIIKKK